MKYIFTNSFNKAINKVFGQLHIPSALLPGKNTLDKIMYESERYGQLCSLFFIGQYILTRVLLPAEVHRVCQQNQTGFLSIHSGNKQRSAIHRDVSVLLRACKRKLVEQ